MKKIDPLEEFIDNLSNLISRDIDILRENIKEFFDKVRFTEYDDWLFDINDRDELANMILSDKEKCYEILKEIFTNENKEDLIELFKIVRDTLDFWEKSEDPASSWFEIGLNQSILNFKLL